MENNMGFENNHDFAFVITLERLQVLQKWALIASSGEQEDNYLCQQISNQLRDMVAKLFDEKLDQEIDKIDHTVYGTPVENWGANMRDDIPVKWIDPDAVLECAPKVSERFFVVPISKTIR